MQKYSIQINDYEKVRKINSGAFGQIYEVRNKLTQQKYAAKIIFASDSSQKIDREIQIMIQYSHPTIINFLGFSKTDFSGNENATIIMDLAEKGSLHDILTNIQRGLTDDGYDNTKRQIILIGISYGMMQLHANRVIHRDLKPGNILIDGLFQPHITDFGLSKIFKKGHSKSQSKECGTIGYMAPEIIKNEKYSTKADVFSFAIIMFEVVTDLKPYPLFDNHHINEFQLNQKIVDENYRPQFLPQVNVKKNIKKLIKKCWEDDPNDRPSFEDIFQMLAYDQQFIIDDDIDMDKIEEYVDYITKNKIIIRNSFMKNVSMNSSSIKSGKKMIRTEQDQIIAELIEQIEKQNKEIQMLKERDEIKSKQIQKLTRQIEMRDDQITQINSQIKKKDDQINQLNLQIKKKDDQIQYFNKNSDQNRSSSFQKNDFNNRKNNFRPNNYNDTIDRRRYNFHFDDDDEKEGYDPMDEPPYEYGRDHVRKLNTDYVKTGDYLTDLERGKDYLNRQMETHKKRSNDYYRLMDQLVQIQEKLSKEDNLITSKSRSINYDKPRIEYLRDYFTLQDELRRKFPQNRDDLNQRAGRLLNDLYSERNKNQRNDAFVGRLLSGIGPYQPNNDTSKMIQQLESYLKRNR